MKLVKFVGTASRNDGTGVISGLEGRPDILLGGEGHLTDDEYAGLSQSGLVLQVIDLGEESLDALKDRAELLGLDVSNLRSKKDYVEAIHGRLETEAVPPEPTVAPDQTASTGPTT